VTAKDRLIVALDCDSEAKALEIFTKLKNDIRFFKIGLEIFSYCGPRIAEKIMDAGAEVFLDLKFHDIPNTVLKASVAATRLGVYMFNVHALGGYDMMKSAFEAAREEADTQNIRRPKVLAVTILTSMDEFALKKIGVNANIKKEVLALAGMAKEAGLDGVVASPHEAKTIREAMGEDFLIVTPGVRPAEAKANDQKRIATPLEAVKNGANFIVVGRPITDTQDPAGAARQILSEIA
jgi:orotidine-5'-phosphate decarboxylase